jgi:hypothetical protein
VIRTMVRAAPDAVMVHLIMYSPPVTRGMLRLNDLGYHSLPALPKGWKPPQWLTLELGIFAGRLYFEWGEYDGVCRVLGVDPSAWTLDEEEDDPTDDEDAARLDGTEPPTGTPELTIDGAAESTALLGSWPRGTVTDASSRTTAAARSFCRKPLSFMAEWLGLRRKGVDFAHSPMGLMSQGKPLHAEHAFFRKVEDATSARGLVSDDAGARDDKVADEEEIGIDHFEDVHDLIDEGHVEDKIEYTHEELNPSAVDEPDIYGLDESEERRDNTMPTSSDSNDEARGRPAGRSRRGRTLVHPQHPDRGGWRRGRGRTN